MIPFSLNPCIAEIYRPTHFIVQYHTLYSIAKKVIESTVFFQFLRIICEILDQIIDTEAQGFLNISEKGLDILSKCKKEFQYQQQTLLKKILQKGLGVRKTEELLYQNQNQNQKKVFEK